MLKNIAELRKNLADKVTELRSLNKEKFSEEEKTKFEAVKVEVEDLRSFIAREEELQALEMDNPMPDPPAGDPNQPEARGFKNLGEQLMAVVNASRAGARPDPRLVEFRAPTGMNEAIPSEGGFLVQKDFAAGLLQRAYATGILASRVNKVPIGANSNGLLINGIDEASRANGSRYGGLQTYWPGEAGLKVPSKPKFRQINLKLKKIIGLCYSTDELLQDAVALESIITQGFQNEFAFVMDDVIFRGSGVGQPLGFINAPCLVTVSKEANQAADTVVYENVMKMWARVWSGSRPNSIWLINQEIEPQLFSMSIQVGLGGIPVYMPAGGISGAPYGSLMGRPVIPIEQASALGDLGDISIADFTQYLMIDKGGIQTATSIHVQFLYDEQVFRFVYRVDGMPAWNVALTPYKGAGTLSPFVTLEAR